MFIWIVHDCLIFKTGIPILVRWCLCIESSPWCCYHGSRITITTTQYHHSNKCVLNPSLIGRRVLASVVGLLSFCWKKCSPRISWTFGHTASSIIVIISSTNKKFWCIYNQRFMMLVSYGLQIVPNLLQVELLAIPLTYHTWINPFDWPAGNSNPSIDLRIKPISSSVNMVANHSWHLLSHPSILGVTLCFCTSSYAAAAACAAAAGGRRFLFTR